MRAALLLLAAGCGRPWLRHDEGRFAGDWSDCDRQVLEAGDDELVALRDGCTVLAEVVLAIPRSPSFVSTSHDEATAWFAPRLPSASGSGARRRPHSLAPRRGRARRRRGRRPSGPSGACFTPDVQTRLTLPRVGERPVHRQLRRRTSCLPASCGDVAPDTCRTTCLLPACGDGVLDGGEGCDDGNRVSGDGCATSCLVEGDVCSAPAIATYDAATGTATVSGDTTGFQLDYLISCGPGNVSPDFVASFTSPFAAQWYFELVGSFDTMLAAHATCGVEAAELACNEVFGTGESVTITLGAGESTTLRGGAARSPALADCGTARARLVRGPRRSPRPPGASRRGRARPYRPPGAGRRGRAWSSAAGGNAQRADHGKVIDPGRRGLAARQRREVVPRVERRRAGRRRHRRMRAADRAGRGPAPSAPDLAPRADPFPSRPLDVGVLGEVRARPLGRAPR